MAFEQLMAESMKKKDKPDNKKEDKHDKKEDSSSKQDKSQKSHYSPFGHRASTPTTQETKTNVSSS